MTDRIEKTIELAAPVERVWRALTDHAEFGQWFRVKLDGPFVEGRPSRGRSAARGARTQLGSGAPASKTHCMGSHLIKN